MVWTPNLHRVNLLFKYINVLWLLPYPPCYHISIVRSVSGPTNLMLNVDLFIYLGFLINMTLVVEYYLIYTKLEFRIRIIFDIENSIWKSNLGTSWRGLPREFANKIKCSVSVLHGTFNYVYPKIILYNRSHVIPYLDHNIINSLSKLEICREYSILLVLLRNTLDKWFTN